MIASPRQPDAPFVIPSLFSLAPPPFGLALGRTYGLEETCYLTGAVDEILSKVFFKSGRIVA
jgi:hypothetical protein